MAGLPVGGTSTDKLVTVMSGGFVRGGMVVGVVGVAECVDIVNNLSRQIAVAES